MPRLGKVALSAMFSISNFFFLGEQGYFNAESIYKPLLHSWSLGVEEQFYLIWPALLFVLHKLGKAILFWIVLLLLSLSFGFSLFFVDGYSNMVFFMLPFRIFEFCFGFLALWAGGLFNSRASTSRFLFFMGLALILFACFAGERFFENQIFVQGVACLGTLLMLAFGLATKNFLHVPFLDRGLSLVGSSSYSIYLIHWPLIVFYKMYRIEELQNWEKVLLFFVSLILGWLMWKYIENKFRYYDASQVFRFNRFVPVGMIVVILLSLYNLNSNKEKSNESEGMTEMFVGEKQEVSNLTSEDLEAEMKRYWKNAEPNSPILKGTNNKNIIVMGNSHAVDLIYAFRRNGLEAEISSLPTTHLCYHFGSKAILKKDKEKCEKVKNRNLKHKSWKTADAIFLHDHWPVEETSNLKSFVTQMRKKTKAPIYIFGPKTVFKSTIPQIVKASGTDDPKAINAFAIKYSDLKKRSNFDRQLNQLFDQIFMKKQNIHYISLMGAAGLKDIISPESKEYFYFDKSHLTELGAIELGRRIKAIHPALFQF